MKHCQAHTAAAAARRRARGAARALLRDWLALVALLALGVVCPALDAGPAAAQRPAALARVP